MISDSSAMQRPKNEDVRVSTRVNKSSVRDDDPTLVDPINKMGVGGIDTAAVCRDTRAGIPAFVLRVLQNTRKITTWSQWDECSFAHQLDTLEAPLADRLSDISATKGASTIYSARG